MPVHFLTNSDGLINDRNFYLASRSFASDFPDIVKIVMGETRQMAIWITKNPEPAAKLLAERTGMKITTARMLTKSRRFDLLPIQNRAVEEQQRISEIFFRLGLIPDRLWIEDAIWKQKLDTAYPRFMEFCRDTAMPCPYGDLSIRDVLHQRGICCKSFKK